LLVLLLCSHGRMGAGQPSSTGRSQAMTCCGPRDRGETCLPVDVGLPDGPLMCVELPISEHMGGHKEFGNALWPSGHMLAHALATEKILPPGTFAGKSVLELGAGVGLPSIVVAKLGASDVVMTDMVQLLELGTRNAEANDVIDKVEVLELDWDKPEASPVHGRHFDYVIAADVIYKEAVGKLKKALRAVVQNETVFVLAYFCRARAGEGHAYMHKEVLPLFDWTMQKHEHEDLNCEIYLCTIKPTQEKN